MPSRTLAGGLALKGDWALGEDLWKDEMDNNLLWLSVLTLGRFTDVVGAEPGAPAEGDVYILAAAHATHPNEIAVYDEAAWHYRAPLTGWRLFNVTLGVFQQFSGTDWVADTASLSAEDVRDVIAAALVSGTNVSIVPNDGADTITINATGDGTGATDEQIQDMISTFLQQGSNVTLTYDDTGNHLTIAAAASGFAPLVFTIEGVAATAYTFASADSYKHKQFTAATAVAATIPKDATDNVPVGTRIRCSQAGAGTVTITPEDGTVTVRSRGGALQSAGQYAVFEIEKLAANTWIVLGDVA